MARRLQVLTELKSYVTLAEKLGRLVVQFVAGGSGVKFIKGTYASTRAPNHLDTRFIRAMLTEGLIEPISNILVNLVNADFPAKQRGIHTNEEGLSWIDHPLELIKVHIANVESKFISSTFYSCEVTMEDRGKDGVPHLSKVGLFEEKFELGGGLINMRFMSVGRIIPCWKQSLIAIRVDDERNNSRRRDW